jgi:electron transfer flavoprotein beta subunit
LRAQKALRKLIFLSLTFVPKTTSQIKAKNMKILVAISQTPDTTAKVSFSADAKTYNEAGVQFIMNPYDEWYALVRACELKETLGGTVTVINVGPATNEASIRKALAIGADDAVRVDQVPDSAMTVAKQISAHAAGQGYDLILFGKETIDHNGSEIGAMVSEMLDLPFISYANKLEINGTVATVSREIEGGTETAEVDLPVVISAAKGMAEQRIPNMMGIMKSRSKPVAVLAPVASTDHVKIHTYILPPAKTGVKLIEADQVEELVRLLHEEAKAI